MSQESCCSTIPYELSQDQDPEFVDELNYVNELYFKSLLSQDHNETLLLQNSESENESEFDNINYESDVDDDDIIDGTPVNADNGIVGIELSDTDIQENQKQNKFKTETCGCSHFYDGKPCSEELNFDTVVEFRQFCQELNKDELDLVIKAELYNHRQSGTKTSSTKHKLKDRVRPSQQYFFRGNRICRRMFCFLHGIEQQKLHVLGRSLDADGLKPRVHGLKGKRPPNSLTCGEIEHIRTFLSQYATDHALPLPGRLPNFKHAQVLLLPSDRRQADIHEIYIRACQESGIRSASLSTFSRTWKELCPNIVLSKPNTDLCHHCQKLTHKIANSGSLEEEEKIAVIENYNSHLKLAKQERNVYRAECLASKQTCKDSQCIEGSAPCSLQGTVHYSWDYAQQVHIPHHSQEVGPIFFKTPRKCEVFGICCEGTGKQTFYLIDESESVGKGANSVVSFVHHYLTYYGLGEINAEFHFDNCTGQNKNNTVLWYALWRVSVGLHHSIKYGTMVAGHTKFEPDWHFGLWKSKWRHCDAETIDDISETVLLSSRSGHNIPQLVNDRERPVTFFKWREFLKQYFKPLKHITKYHHFTVSSSEPGVVSCKEFANSPEEKINLLQSSVLIEQGLLPEQLSFKGLDPERQWYLYSQIRDYCLHDSAKDLTCPRPLVAKSYCSNSTENPKKRKYID